MRKQVVALLMLRVSLAPRPLLLVRRRVWISKGLANNMRRAIITNGVLEYNEALPINNGSPPFSQSVFLAVELPSLAI